MPKSAFHVLHPQSGENGVLADLHAVAQPRDLGINRLNFLVFLPELATDFLVRLPIAHVALIERLDALKNGLPLFPRLVCLSSFLFDLVFKLFQRPSFSVDLFIDGIGGDAGRCPQPDDQHRSDPGGPAQPHTLASSNRRSETKLPAHPRTMPTTTSSRQIESGKNIVSCSRPRNRPVVRI